MITIDKTIPSWDELEKKLGRKLVTLNQLRENKQVTMDTTTFNALIEDNTEWLKEMVYKVGVDVQPNNKHGYSRVKYAVNGEALIDFFDKHKTVAEIARIIGVDKRTIFRYMERGFMGEDLKSYPYKSFDLYNVEDMAKRYKKAEDQAFENYQMIGPKEPIYDDYLPEEIVKTIDSYIAHRLSNTPGITIGGIKMNNSGFIKNDVADKHHKMLKSIFFQIMCLLQGIELDESVKTKIRMRNYSDEESELLNDFDKSCFDLRDFDTSIINLLSKTLAPSTVEYYVNDVLKPFYYYYLMIKEKENKKQRMNPKLSMEERYILRENFDMLKEAILDTFNQIVKVKYIPNKNKKAFLTRENYDKLYHKVFSKQGIIKAVSLELGFRLALRASEASLIAVEDFWIDENGFLKTDSMGYGKLYIPAPKCKDGVDGGAEERGLEVPPATVKLFNSYLKNLVYVACPFKEHLKAAGKTFETTDGKIKVYHEGHGFFLRDQNYLSKFDKNISSSSVGKFLREIRSECAFLPENQRKHLSFHDGRHTLNEWIETAIVEPDLQPYVDMIADFQMKHSQRDIGKTNYRDLQIQDQYRQIIEKTINFPLDLTELRKWEIENLYKKPEDNEIEVDERTKVKIDTTSIVVNDPFQTPVLSLSKDEKNQLKIELAEIEKELKAITQRPKGMGAMDWTKLRVALKDKKTAIEEKLRLAN